MKQKWHISGVYGPILTILVSELIFKGSELIAFVFKMIVRQGHSQTVILKVKFKENVSSEGFRLSHTRHNELVADCIPLNNPDNFIFIINIFDT